MPFIAFRARFRRLLSSRRIAEDRRNLSLKSKTASICLLSIFVNCVPSFFYEEQFFSDRIELL